MDNSVISISHTFGSEIKPHITIKMSFFRTDVMFMRDNRIMLVHNKTAHLGSDIFLYYNKDGVLYV